MFIKHQLIYIIALLLLACVILTGGLNLCNNAIDVFSDVTIANFDYSEGSSPITSGFILNLSERLKSEFVTFLSFGEETQVKHMDVTPVYTTYSLANLLHMDYKGSFFTETQQENRDNLVIISESLARELYFSTDVVGRTFELEEKNYIISGVYSENKGVIHHLSKDSREKVYIPYTCSYYQEDLTLDTVIYDSRSNSAAVIEQLNLPQYSFQSLASQTLVVSTLKSILLLTLYSGALVLFTFIWYKLSGYLLSKLKAILSGYYFFEAIKSEPLTFVLFILVVVGIPSIFITVFFMSDFSVYIIPEYTPYDNIFDIGYYFSAYLSNHRSLNALSLSGENYYMNFYSYTFFSVLWLWVVFLIVYSILIFRIYRALRNNVSLFQKIK